MLAVFNFVTKHYFGSKFGPMFRIVFPLILVLLLGEINVINKYNALNEFSTQADFDAIGTSLRSATSGVVASSMFIIAFNNFPTSIAVYKDTVILKRISATRITKLKFFIATLSFYLLLIIFTIFYSMLLSGLIIATRLTKLENAWEYVLPMSGTIGETIGFMILSIFVFLLFGLTIGSLLRRVRTIGMVSGVIQFPTTLLIGGLVSPELLAKSDVLGAIRYIFAHTQPAVGLTSFWRIGSMPETDIYVAIGISLALIIMFSIIIWKRFRWTD